jgi:hypothetical protein
VSEEKDFYQGSEKEKSGVFCWLRLDIETGLICPKTPSISYYQGKSA